MLEAESQEPRKKDKSDKGDKRLLELPERKEVFEDVEYSNHLTPLVLASQLERVDMVELLIDRVKGDGNAIHPVSSGFFLFFLCCFLRVV